MAAVALGSGPGSRRAAQSSPGGLPSLESTDRAAAAAADSRSARPARESDGSNLPAIIGPGPHKELTEPVLPEGLEKLRYRAGQRRRPLRCRRPQHLRHQAQYPASDQLPLLRPVAHHELSAARRRDRAAVLQQLPAPRLACCQIQQTASKRGYRRSNSASVTMATDESAAPKRRDRLDGDGQRTAVDIERRNQAKGTLRFKEPGFSERQGRDGRRPRELDRESAGGGNPHVRLPRPSKVQRALVQGERDLSAGGRRDGDAPAWLGQLRVRRERPAERVRGPQLIVATPLYGIEEPVTINPRTRSAVKDGGRRKRAGQADDGATRGTAGRSSGADQELVRAPYEGKRHGDCGDDGCREHGNDERPATPMATRPAPTA